MTSRAAAIRYARALFDVLLAEGADIDRADRELATVAALVSGNEQLARVLTNPAIPAAKKRAVMQELISRSAGLLPQVSKLLLLLADRDRLGLLTDAVDAYRTRLMDHHKVVRADLVTAIPLPADRVTALREGLAPATGRQVHLDTRIDPAIVGGAVARVGSTVYDGSVTRQLEKMKEALTSGAE